MSWVVGGIICVLIFVIAAFAIGRETHRLDAVAPSPTFDVDEAVDWISERLDPEISAQISYEDVRDLVLWHLEDLDERGVTPTLGPDGEAVIVDDEGSVDALALRALASGRDINPAHIKAVLDSELGYFAAIGAIGPVAAPDQPE